MSFSLNVKIEGLPSWRKLLSGVAAPAATRALTRTLRRSAAELERLAKTKYIRRGGGAPVEDRLTTRTGRLARSIGSDFSQLPRRALVGTNVLYGPPHEFGGRVRQTVAAHTRRMAFGRPTRPFRVGAFTRTVNYPERPFLGPAARDVGSRFFGRELQRQVRRELQKARR